MVLEKGEKAGSELFHRNNKIVKDVTEVSNFEYSRIG